MTFLEEVENYGPYDAEEKNAKDFILDFYARHGGDIFTRDNAEGHVTASTWAVNPKLDKALMVYHNIYDSFSWAGGHADGDTDLRRVAERELKEETGVENPRLLLNDILSINIGTVIEHMKRGKRIAPHLHIDFCYLFEVDEKEKLRPAEAENSAVKWIPFEEMEKVVTEKSMLPIYAKLIRKTRELEL
jgi:ADP-ribose pyrophosphatase YjhB (NUDIX family)